MKIVLFLSLIVLTLGRKIDEEMEIKNDKVEKLDAVRALSKLLFERQKRDVSITNLPACNIRVTDDILRCPIHKLTARCPVMTNCKLVLNKGWVCSCPGNQLVQTCCKLVCT